MVVFRSFLLLCIHGGSTIDIGPTYGRDYSHYDYQETPLHSPSSASANHYQSIALACESNCIRDPRCCAWTYCPPNSGGGERCCLKNGVGKESDQKNAKKHWTGLAPRAVTNGSLSQLCGGHAPPTPSLPTPPPTPAPPTPAPPTPPPTPFSPTPPPTPSHTPTPYPGPAFQHPRIHNCPVCVSTMDGWHDMAGALTFKGVHHVWQGCPVSGGWHHSTSPDLVHWDDRGVDVKQILESHAGMESNSPPCSGFVSVDDDGIPCAGFRQCSSTKGVHGGQSWDVPLELRCASDEGLTQWSAPIWLYDVFFYRYLPYDPVRPWVDTDGKWYSAISSDGCNSTNATIANANITASATDEGGGGGGDSGDGEHGEHGEGSSHIYCKQGGRLDLWGSPALRGNRSNWTYIGPMFTTTRSSQGNQITKEFVTTGYFGFGEGGSIRVVTQNAEGANYWIGTQSNGSTFTVDWQDFGATGYYDYGSLTMARTLSTDPNQVAKEGRRTLLGWIGTKNVQKSAVGPASQSLARDLTLFTPAEGQTNVAGEKAARAGVGAGPILLQQFVPELQSLRVPNSMVKLSDNTTTGFLRTEIVAAFTYTNVDAHGKNFDGKFGVSVLGSKDGKSRVEVTIDCSNRVAGNVQVSADKVFCTATCGKPSKLFPAPLLPQVTSSLNSTATEVHLHIILDHSIIECIFNNRTAMAISGVGGKSEHDTDIGLFGVGTGGVQGDLTAWQLAPANN